MNLVGQTIDRYRILEQLGQGGMALVYKAYDTRLEREVALKVIRRKALPEEHLERLLQRFEREAKAQAGFNHPNIVQVYDFGEYEGAPYLVMAMLSGGTLKARTGRPMPVAEAAALLAPIASALAYAHARKILHRDVKPSNILIDEHGTPFLTDFGIAKLLEAEEGYTLTGTGMGVGTPEYMAPEQWKGQAGPQTDIYALGVVLYELVTGRKPYTADTPAAVAIMQAIEPLPLPRQFAADLPETAEKVILKALALKPEDRYESMAAFGAALTGMFAPVAAAPASGKAVTPAKRPALKPEPEPETRDEIATDPVMRTEAVRKAGLPPWAWVAGVIGLVAVVALLMSQAGARPQAAVVAQPTNTATAPQTLQATRSHTATPTRTNTPTTTPVIGSSFINSFDGARLFYIPEGEFIMGSESGQFDEQPVRTIYLDSFWMYETEVTVGQFVQFVYANGGDVSRYDLSQEDLPVNYIDWEIANQYCKWARGRLPTEAEWEKAARGTDGRTYPWGNTFNFRRANSRNDGDGYEVRAPVGSFPDGASPYGLMDLAGNLSEWVADWYDANYYMSSPQENPLGPQLGDYHVRRGGSYYNYEFNLRATARELSQTNSGSALDGFRCAMTKLP